MADSELKLGEDEDEFRSINLFLELIVSHTYGTIYIDVADSLINALIKIATLYLLSRLYLFMLSLYNYFIILIKSHLEF